MGDMADYVLEQMDYFEEEDGMFEEEDGLHAPPRREWSTCPRCGGQLVERTNKISLVRFMGCSTFPRCRGSVAMENYYAAPTEPTL